MRSTRYIIAVLILALFGGTVARRTWGETAPSREYEVKAAFLYNFLKFIDWPNGKSAEAEKPIILGIIGKDRFGNAFDPVRNKKVKGRKVVVKRLAGIAELKKLGREGKDELTRQTESMKKCHLLFVCSSEKDVLKEIMVAVQGQTVLTVGDWKGFLKAGGIINFVMEEQKVRFEINATAAKRSKLKVRSQLLRLAKKVVK